MNPTDLPPVDSPTRTRPPVRRFARASRWLIAILLVFGGLYALQQLSAPQVDESLISPVVISHADGSGTPVAESPAVDNIEATATSILAGITQESIDAAEHPNLPLLEVARAGLKEIDKTIQDYEATLVSQVFARGKLHDENYMFVKIRHQHETDDGSTVPFSVYTKFLKPVQKVGQEAIWVQGQNEGKLIAHTTGLMNVKRFYLDPKGPIAMQGNRYPIETIGFRNLLEKIIEFGEKDIQYGECEVTITRNVQMNGRSCIILEAVHPQKRPHFEFHISKIYLDDKLGIPIAYEGYLWPENEGEDPPLLEKYYYTDIQLNVGLTDVDFDPANEDYDYPAW